MACPSPPSNGIAIEWTYSDNSCRDYLRTNLLGVLKVCSPAHSHVNNINYGQRIQRHRFVICRRPRLILRNAHRRQLSPRPESSPPASVEVIVWYGVAGGYRELSSYLSCCTKCRADEWNVAWLVVYRPDDGAIFVSAWTAGHWE